VVGTPRVDPPCGGSLGKVSPPRTPESAGRPGLACSLPGLGRFPRQTRRSIPPDAPTVTADPSGRGFCETLPNGYPRLADLPSASAPAYRRFRVTGDAEPPGLAHQFKLSKVY